MAHTINYNMKDYNSIWTDVTSIISSADLSFANIEAPVDDNVPWSTFPNFNMHHSYPDAAAKAGFNVFSLANNHSNDQGLEGIKSTEKYFNNLHTSTSLTTRPVYACGLKKIKKSPLTFSLINIKGWKILFVAVTEILNRPDYSDYIDYIPATESKRNTFITQLAELKTKHPCDMFIVSIHCDEPEYVTTVSDERKTFCEKIINQAGVDIVWANHPHVVQPWEILGTKSDNKIHSLIMYANGNTISAQRRALNYKNPSDNNESTGEGLMMKITVEKTDKAFIKNVEPVFITTYIDPSWNFVIRLLDDDFIHSLSRAGLPAQADYYSQRKNIMENIKGNYLWQ